MPISWSGPRTLVVAAALATLAGPVHAQTCGELVDEFAAAHGLAAEAPTVAPPADTPPSDAAGLPPGSAGSDGAQPDGGVTSQDLARSGGVIEPPPSAGSSDMVIEPPQTGSMPTAPAIRPDEGGGSGAPTGEAAGQAALHAQLEATVLAARQAADRGDERQCLQSLDSAQGLVEQGNAVGEGG